MKKSEEGLLRSTRCCQSILKYAVKLCEETKEQTIKN